MKKETVKQKRARRAKDYAKKVRDYAKFLKHDFDWDWSYLIRLIEFKLRRMRDCIAHGYIADKKQVCAQIKEVADLLKKVDSHDYHSEAFKKFHKKYGRAKMVFKECAPPNKHAKQLVFIYPNGKEATKAMNRQHVALGKLADQRMQDDIEKAFSLMAKSLRRWWD